MTTAETCIEKDTDRIEDEERRRLPTGEDEEWTNQEVGGREAKDDAKSRCKGEFQDMPR